MTQDTQGKPTKPIERSEEETERRIVLKLLINT